MNPISGVIKAHSIGELILDKTKINPSETKIVITKTDGDPLEKKDIMQQLISDIFDKEHPILSEDNKTLILVL